MNKKLFAKVKDLCKDTGLSEKYLSAITEKLGGSIEDDSTDEAAITETANLVVEIAKARQRDGSILRAKQMISLTTTPIITAITAEMARARKAKKMECQRIVPMKSG